MKKVLSLLIVTAALAVVACNQGPKEKTTEHGYRMEHIISNGGETAKPGDFVKIFYYTYVNDSLVGSSRKQSPEPMPTPLPDSAQIAQMVASSGSLSAPLDGIFMMAEGDSALIYEELDSMQLKLMPEELAGATHVVHALVLVDILSDEEVESMQAEQEAKQKEMMAAAEAARTRFPEVEQKVSNIAARYRKGELSGDLQTTPTGLKYMKVEEGTGERLEAGEEAQIQYYGCLTNGKMFDNSFERGSPLPVLVGGGRMIPGFDEGVALLNHGDKAALFIPSELGYGAQGAGESIPPDSELIFYIEVL